MDVIKNKKDEVQALREVAFEKKKKLFEALFDAIVEIEGAPSLDSLAHLYSRNPEGCFKWVKQAVANIDRAALLYKINK